MPTMQDINFSFAEAQKAREERRRFLSDIDPRRRSVATSVPDGEGRSPWKVRQLGDADREPRWTVATDKSGKRTFSEHRPAENCGLFDAKNRPQNASRFSLKIVRGVCLCREFDAEAGDFVSCLGATAVELINTGKAEVLEEVRLAALKFSRERVATAGRPDRLGTGDGSQGPTRLPAPAIGGQWLRPSSGLTARRRFFHAHPPGPAARGGFWEQWEQFRCPWATLRRPRRDGKSPPPMNRHFTRAETSAMAEQTAPIQNPLKQGFPAGLGTIWEQTENP